MMDGFFSQKETELSTGAYNKKHTCVSCGLYKHCQSPRMQPFGNFKKKILIVGNGLEEIDDIEGKPFQSRYGRYLKKVLAKYGVDMEDDCLLYNAANCYTNLEEQEGQKMPVLALDSCRKHVNRCILDHTPRLIILLGQNALYSVIGGRWKKDLDTVDKWRGFHIPDQEVKAFICPTFDLKTVMDHKRDEIRTIFEQDIARAVECLDRKFPIVKEPTIKVITDLQVLYTIKGVSAFDYETTGLKPHANGHKIYCCSIAVSKDLVYVFMLPTTKKELQPFLDYLTNDKLRKRAHNMKFETTWSKVILGVEVKNWQWDSMLAAHVLDNRPNITGLKFQTYVQFGIADYDSEINPYLHANGDNANCINRIEELLKLPQGKSKLLKYCGYDSIYEFRLAEKQRREMGYENE